MPPPGFAPAACGRSTRSPRGARSTILRGARCGTRSGGARKARTPIRIRDDRRLVLRFRLAVLVLAMREAAVARARGAPAPGAVRRDPRRERATGPGRDSRE